MVIYFDSEQRKTYLPNKLHLYCDLVTAAFTLSPDTHANMVLDSSVI